MTTIVAKEEDDKDYSIKPENTGPVVDTSDWPLLLKNYGRLLIRTGYVLSNATSPRSCFTVIIGFDC